MRRATHGDAVSVARVLLCAPRHRRAWVMVRLFCEAERAHDHVASKGRAHPLWGDGSLMTAALRRHPGPEPFFDNPEYCQCLSLTFAALACRADQPLARERQLGASGSSVSRACPMSSPHS